MLPDVLQSGLSVVFCGTAVSKRSAKLKAYYSGRGNRFWSILTEIGLTPVQFNAPEFINLPKHGVGLTDLVKSKAGNDSQLKTEDIDVVALRKKIEKCQPSFLCFNGKRSARIYLKRPTAYGLQPETIVSTKILVLPSTSGAARRFWDDAYWHELGKLVQKAKRT